MKELVSLKASPFFMIKKIILIKFQNVSIIAFELPWFSSMSSGELPEMNVLPRLVHQRMLFVACLSACTDFFDLIDFFTHFYLPNQIYLHSILIQHKAADPMVYFLKYTMYHQFLFKNKNSTVPGLTFSPSFLRNSPL
jgi:hypothetical protein